MSTGDTNYHYHDYADDGITGVLLRPETGQKHATTGDSTFPEKLHYMLSQIEKEGKDHVISWQPHGRSFRVHNRKHFAKEMLPLWFRQSKYPSFQRQLNLYEFRYIESGPDKGGYFHELFLRGRFDLSKYIVRIKIKGASSKRLDKNKFQPNFYSGLYKSLPKEGKLNSVTIYKRKSTIAASRKERQGPNHQAETNTSRDKSSSETKHQRNCAGSNFAAPQSTLCAHIPHGTNQTNPATQWVWMENRCACFWPLAGNTTINSQSSRASYVFPAGHELSRTFPNSMAMATRGQCDNPCSQGIQTLSGLSREHKIFTQRQLLPPSVLAARTFLETQDKTPHQDNFGLAVNSYLQPNHSIENMFYQGSAALSATYMPLSSHAAADMTGFVMNLGYGQNNEAVVPALGGSLSI